MGIITENKEVICSLKEYNQYRKYLKRLHLDAVTIENKRRVSANKVVFPLSPQNQ